MWKVCMFVLGKICSEQDDMKKDQTMVHYDWLHLAFFFFLMWPNDCLIPCSSHPRPQAESQFLSLSLSDGLVVFVTPIVLCFLSITSLPLDIIKKGSLCFQACLAVTAPVNNSTATHCLLIKVFSTCFYWHSEAESLGWIIVMWHWLWCAQWNRNL